MKSGARSAADGSPGPAGLHSAFRTPLDFPGLSRFCPGSVRSRPAPFGFPATVRPRWPPSAPFAGAGRERGREGSPLVGLGAHDDNLAADGGNPPQHAGRAAGLLVGEPQGVAHGRLLLLAAAGDVEVEAERGEEALVAQRVGVELAREADFEVARADVALLHEAQRDAPGGAGTRAEQHPVGGQLRAGGLRFGPEGRIGIHAKCDFFGHGRQDFVLPLHRGQ